MTNLELTPIFPQLMGQKKARDFRGPPLVMCLKNYLAGLGPFNIAPPKYE